MSVSREDAAFGATISYGLGDTLFKWLKPGEQFRFKASPPEEVFTKTARGYRAQDGRTYRTGQLTAVFKVTP